MIKIKRAFIIVLCLCFAFAVVSCAKEEQNNNKINESESAGQSQTAENSEKPVIKDEYKPKVLTLKGPTGMGMTYLMDDNSDKYDIEIASTPDDVVSAFASGNCDIAAVPINLAAALYNKLDGKVRMTAINTLGVLYIVENGDTIKSIKDLEGKTLYATGQASTPEYIINYILKKNGLKDVKVEYVQEHSELTTMLAGNKAKIGMLPEPNVTTAMMKNKDLRIALNLTDEWSNISNAKLAQGCLIARESFINEHETVMKSFLEDYKNGIDKIFQNTETAAKSIAKNGIVPNEAIANKALPNCNIVFLTGEDMIRISNEMFRVLFDANPKSVGGSIPKDDMYYIYK